jgi:hypothetical protein
MPMHGLDLVLHLKGIVLYKVYNRNNDVLWKFFQTLSKPLVLPLCYNTVLYKKLQLRFEISQELIRGSVLV